MRLIDTRIEIAAPAARVWGVLTDFPRFPEWNPFITRIEGTPEPGAPLRVQIKPPGESAMTFTPTVLVARPEKELRWRGRLLLPGIFDGEHAFELESRGDGCRSASPACSCRFSAARSRRRSAASRR